MFHPKLARAISITATVAFTLVTVRGGIALASTFQVNPIRIYLSQRSSSQLLTIKNDSAERIRFQVSVFAWDQASDGEMILTPTEDVIFYPNLLTAEPNEERKIRVGVNSSFSGSEKSYRIFVEELPSAETKEQNGVRILTKMGIPVFVQPAKLNPLGKINTLNVTKGQFSFTLNNSGNSHFFPRTVAVLGKNGRGEVVLNGQLQPWYILAGGTREYSVKLQGKDCPQIQELSVEIQLDDKKLAETISMPRNLCQE
jgi:fimbrial chaperone protein